MQTVLLLSRDERLRITRSLLCRKAGFRTLLAPELSDALIMANLADLAIVGHTFAPDEQDHFVEQVHETNPGLCVVCLRHGAIGPETLLSVCNTYVSSQPGSAATRVIEGDKVIPWPRQEPPIAPSIQERSA